MNAKGVLSLLVLSVASTLIATGCNRATSDTHISIYYAHDMTADIRGDAQVELASPKGIRVIIDVAIPAVISKPPTREDILLTTHTDYDHYSYSFASAFPGKQLCKEEGRIDASDVKVSSIPSSHSDEPPSDKPPYTNIIYVIDINGLRVAHFGDTRQLKLTEKQIKELGKVDIAFMNFWGEEERFFIHVKQLKPRVVIPTHLGSGDTNMKAAFGMIMKTWPTYMVEEKQVDLSSSALPRKTSFLLVGERTKEYSRTFSIPKWKTR